MKVSIYTFFEHLFHEYTDPEWWKPGTAGVFVYSRDAAGRGSRWM